MAGAKMARVAPSRRPSPRPRVRPFLDPGRTTTLTGLARRLLPQCGMVKTILVIDDDPAVLRSYGRLLGRLGCTVRLVGSVEEALCDPRLLQGVDLLILDERMLGMSGLDLLASVRASARPEVLLVSALANDDLRARAATLGVVEVIEKPVNPARLLGSVRAALDRP